VTGASGTLVARCTALPLVAAPDTHADLGFSSGPYRTRTCDPLRVMQVRYQLRQRPVVVQCSTF